VAFRLGRARGSLSLKREVILNVFFIYILCLIGVTLFPLEISFDKNYRWISVNVIPVIVTIKDIAHTTNDPNMPSYMIKFWIKNIGGNLILLLPLGIMVPMLWGKFNGAVKTTLYAFCLSLSIEALQLASFYIGNTGRAFDIDDILLNTIGAYIGYIIYKKFIENSKYILNKHLQNV
jgi:glycopeptide antibiotics resistance protein